MTIARQRASEIVDRVVRDLDDGGALLWIPNVKTAKGRRTVPEALTRAKQQRVLTVLAGGKR